MVNNEIEKNLSSELNYTEQIKQEVILNQEQSASALNFNYHIEKMRNFLHDTYPMKQEVRLQVEIYLFLFTKNIHQIFKLIIY